MIDLRSDTVTRPSKGMLQAMLAADVGDDVFGEDPTTNALQLRMASMFGKEAALFVPSGTMGNEICVKAHTQPGDEIVLEQESHIFVYETAGPAFLAGVQMMPIPGIHGVLPIASVKAAIRAKTYYLPATRLICIENTHGRSAGSVYPLEELKSLRALTLAEGIRLHLDGARIWNASVASGVSVRDYAREVDSLSVCFSKGLGAPVGSMILGDEDFVERARRLRKIFGGGMRQVGILAAAANYALDHNVERLREDHEKAQFFAAAVADLPQLAVDRAEVQTNMVFIDARNTGRSQQEVLELLRSKGVLLTPERSSSIRAVMHLDVSMEDVRQAAKMFRLLFS